MIIPASERSRYGPWVLVGTGLAAALIVLLAVAVAAEPFQPDAYGPGHDARAYWIARFEDPYAISTVGGESAYLYSPAFLQLIEPLRGLGWTPFLVLWTTIQLAILLWLVGPLLLAGGVLFALLELWGGNIHLGLAAAVVVGIRWPAAWAFVLLTKVTPGIGLLWFAARREWRALAIALIATALIAGISWLIVPQAWGDWIHLLAQSTQASTVPGSIPIPLVLRFPIAAVLVWYAARTDRPWLLPLGVMLALPVLWWGSLAMITGSVALERRRIERWLRDHLRLDRL